MFNLNKMLWLIFIPALLLGSLGFLYQIPSSKISIILIFFVLIILLLSKASKNELQNLRENPEKAEELKYKYKQQDKFLAKYDFFIEIILYIAFSIIGSFYLGM